MEFDDFEEFTSMSVTRKEKGELATSDTNKDNNKDKNNLPTKADRMVDAITGNFDKILSLVGDVVEIKKMKVQSEAVLRKMEEDRKALLAEAEAYALKRNADTKSIVDRMNVVRMILKDFYEANDGSISSEDFRIIITETINQMGRIQ